MAKVVFTESAKLDLLGIEHYISVKLKNPQAAKRITNGILNATESLMVYPDRHALVNDELLRRIGLRMIRFQNYNIFYHYNLEKDAVYILRVLYNRADWKNIL